MQLLDLPPDLFRAGTVSPTVGGALRLRGTCRLFRSFRWPLPSTAAVPVVMGICANIARQCDCGASHCGVCRNPDLPATFARAVLAARFPCEPSLLVDCFDRVLVETLVLHFVTRWSVPNRHRALRDYRLNGIFCDCPDCYRRLPCGRGRMRPWTPRELAWWRACAPCFASAVVLARRPRLPPA